MRNKRKVHPKVGIFDIFSILENSQHHVGHVIFFSEPYKIDETLYHFHLLSAN